ncbi:hypothetical protein DVS28_b0188 (plasmid) [Euzebya pacifica]|uniref:Uncharacterized protein n=1 Tax=Euzebya pacifica TaxID=1608957 RepID=A0A346Y661_9ACTN|nr:hypothetical protein [Euzebya pacifica]AXV09958.1 hypothetical protein DVS28_b0188 [Euzebya pacifica]
MTTRSAHTRTDPATGRRIPVRAHRVRTGPPAPPAPLTPEAADRAFGPAATTDPLDDARTTAVAAAFADPDVRLWPATAPVHDQWVVRADGATVVVSTHRDNPDGDGLIEHVAVGTIVPAGTRWGYPADEADMWIMWDHQTNHVPLGRPDDVGAVRTIALRDGEATPFTTVSDVLTAVTTEAAAGHQ